MIAHAQPPRPKNLTPDDYLTLCRQVSALPEDQRQRRINALTATNTYSVDGSVYLGAQRDKYTVLVPAKIAGSLNLENAQNIRELHGLTVAGDVEAKKSGIQSISSSFSCGGDLKVVEAKNLRSLDCKVGGRVDAYGSGLEKTTPNFSCGKDLNISGMGETCEKFHTLAGRVGGDVQASGDVMPDCPKYPRSVLAYPHGHPRGGGFGSLSTIDEAFECGGNMFINYCPNLKKLAGKVRGRVVANFSGLEKISPSFEAHNDPSVSNQYKGLYVEGCKNLRVLDGKVPSGAYTSGVMPFAPSSQYGPCSGLKPNNHLHHLEHYQPEPDAPAPAVPKDPPIQSIAGGGVTQIVAEKLQKLFGGGSKKERVG